MEKSWNLGFFGPKYLLLFENWKHSPCLRAKICPKMAGFSAFPNHGKVMKKSFNFIAQFFCEPCAVIDCCYYYLLLLLLLLRLVYFIVLLMLLPLFQSRGRLFEPSLNLNLCHSSILDLVQLINLKSFSL